MPLIVKSQKIRNLKHRVNKVFLRTVRAEKVHCIGDSHLNLFFGLENNYFWLNTDFRFFQVNGATAMGLANPNSKTNALEKFKQYLDCVGRQESVLVSLGEVDCGFVIHYRAKKYMTSVATQFEKSIENYFAFLTYISSLNVKRIIVPSIPLPTIADNQDWGEVANLRREVQTPLKERTSLTLDYNFRLKEFCRQNSFTYISYINEIFDPKTQLINPFYMSDDPLDHHLNADRVSPILRCKLADIAGFW